MLRKFNRLFRALKLGVLWTRARHAASRMEYARAYSTLLSIYQLYGLPIPSDRMMYDVNLLLGVIAFKIEEYELATRATRISLRQINISSKLNFDEKAYLVAYAERVLCNCAFKLGEKVKISGEGDGGGIDMEAVDASIKSTFPL